MIQPGLSIEFQAQSGQHSETLPQNNNRTSKELASHTEESEIPGPHGKIWACSFIANAERHGKEPTSPTQLVNSKFSENSFLKTEVENL